MKKQAEHAKKRVDKRRLDKINAALEAAARQKDFRKAQKIANQTSEVEWSAYTYVNLIHCAVRTNQMDQALQVFDRMKQAGWAPNVVVITCLVKGYGRLGQLDAALELLKASGIPPNDRTILTFLRACWRWRPEVLVVTQFLENHAPAVDLKGWNLGVRLLAREGQYSLARDWWKRGGSPELEGETHCLLAWAAAFSEKPKKFEEHLEKVFELVDAPIESRLAKFQRFQQIEIKRTAKLLKGLREQPVDSDLWTHAYVPLSEGNHLRFKDTVVEICSGSGDWICARAQEHPEVPHYAVELKYDQVFKILQKINLMALTNLRVIHGDAGQLVGILKKVQQVFVNFPEPPAWHENFEFEDETLLTGAFFEQVYQGLRPGAPCTVVTDNQKYAENLLQTGLALNLYEDVQLKPGLPPNYSSRSYFDRFFIQSKGHRSRYTVVLTR